MPSGKYRFEKLVSPLVKKSFVGVRFLFATLICTNDAQKEGMNLPPVIYIRTQDSEILFALKSAVLTEDGAIPAHGLLRRMFDGKTKPPVPIFYKDEIPVFFLPIPSEIFKVMQQGFMFPDSWDTLRDNLPENISQELWDKYVEYYGLVFEEEEPKELEAPEPKRRKVMTHEEEEEFDFQEAEKKRTSPRWDFYRRVSYALAKYIETNCPNWNKLLSGQRTKIRCQFINTFDLDSFDGNLTFRLPVEGDPPIKPVAVAHELGFNLPWNKDDAPCRLTIMSFMEHYWNWKYIVWFTMETTRKSTRKTPVVTDHWPAGKLSLTPKHHDVLGISISLVKE